MPVRGSDARVRFHSYLLRVLFKTERVKDSCERTVYCYLPLDYVGGESMRVNST